jgi:cell division protein FtsB
MGIRLVFSISLLLLSFVLLVFFIFGPNGIIDTYKKQEQIAQLKEKIEKLEEQNQTKKEMIKALKSSNSKEVYTKGIGLNLSEGEYVFKFAPESTLKNQPHKESKDSTYSKFILSISILVLFLTLMEIIMVFLTLKNLKKY